MSKNDMSHELARITQFELEANGDVDKLRQKLLLRAARSGNGKKQRFVDALRLKGYTELATFVDGIMVDKND